MIVPKVFVYETNDSLQRLTFTFRQVKLKDNEKIYISVGLNYGNLYPARDILLIFA